MKRKAALKRVREQARNMGLEYSESELTKHTAVKVGNTSSTLGRHGEIPDVTAKKFFDQFAAEFGKGWWR